MEKISLTPRALVGYMANHAGESRFALSVKLGHTRTYLNQYTTVGKMPSLQNLVEIASVCGYEVHIIGHGEDITVEVPEE